MKNFIPVNEPLLDGNEKKYLNECIDSGWISSEGPFVSEFEQKFSKAVGKKFGAAVSSGTAALDIAIEALEIGKGDEVILPSFTIISCILQVIRSGAKPVLVDSDPLNWNMKVEDIESKITSKTKAVMVVHIYGLPVDIDPVLELCKKHNLKLIEDTAEMIGQTYKGKSCGSFGDVSVFSFYPNKHLTTGEGGMVLTDDESIFLKLKELRNLCFKADNRFVHERLGWNYRMTNIQAALGLAQLERLDEFIKIKRNIGKKYNEYLKDVEYIQLPLAEEIYAQNIYWVYGIVLDKEFGNAKKIMNELQIEGIGTRPFFYPLHLQPALKKLKLFSNQFFPIAENLYEYGFYLPSGLALTDEQIYKSATSLKKILNSL